MLHEKLLSLRKLHRMTQEELAEQVGVSRQAIAKWENGESLPDIERCRLIADAFQVSLDELVGRTSGPGIGVPPKGKHVFGVVAIGEKGQIVIPQQARKIFGIKPGDRWVVLGDENQGIAMIPEQGLAYLWNTIRTMPKE